MRRYIAVGQFGPIDSTAHNEGLAQKIAEAEASKAKKAAKRAQGS